MTNTEFFTELKKRFISIPEVAEAISNDTPIAVRSLTSFEALGDTERKDYPILTGKDVMIECTFLGSKGQAFTDAPVDFTGTLKSVMEYDLENDPYARGMFIAVTNAVLNHLGMSDRCIHCRNSGPKECGRKVSAFIREAYGDPKILLVGYQPSMIENLSKSVTNLRVLDLNPDNIGQERMGITIMNGADVALREELTAWADLVLCTGSTACNGTITDYIGTGTETLFYGTSAAGAASLMGLKRMCFADCVEV